MTNRGETLQREQPIMNAFFKFTCLASVGIIAAVEAPAQPVQITSLSANGQLTVSAPVGSDFDVEWSPTLGSGAAWSDRWDSLMAVHCTNAAMTLNVPMFYRVSCYTNGLLWPLKPGSSFVFVVTNALSETATQSVKVLGRCYAPEFTNNYAVFDEADANVTGGVSGGIMLMRSDDRGVWIVDDPNTVMASHTESQVFIRGTVGTVITNAENVRIAIEAIETVTVPAGTFTNCLKQHKTQLGTSDYNPNWYEWIKPGLGMVKWVDYYTDAAPVVYQLQ
jgi:hypothetical protein